MRAPVTSQFTRGWHLITCSYDGTTDLLTLYLDGAQIFQASSVGAAYMGGPVDIPNSGNPWDGKIDDVRVYNRALTPTEIQQLYKLGTVRITQ